MGPDLDTLATTLYVTVDDLLIQLSRVGAPASRGGDRSQAVRRRVGHPGGDPGAAQVR